MKLLAIARIHAESIRGSAVRAGREFQMTDTPRARDGGAFAALAGSEMAA